MGMNGPGLDTLPLWLNIVVVVATIFLVASGASRLVASAARIARRLGISELVIGLTVVALGTSAPEFAVSVIAALHGQGDISVANIVGSDIFNLGFILGGGAALRPIPTSPPLLWRDGAVLLVAALSLLACLGRDLHLGRSEGLVLISILCGYLLWLFFQRKVLPGSEEETRELLQGEIASHPLWLELLLLVLGLVLVTGGSQLLVLSATSVARDLGVSDWVIGVTIVAVGTSAPELATTVAAVLQKRYDISAGNLIGSDIFNMLGVLGVAATLRPIDVDNMARYSLGGLLVMVVLVLIFIRTGWRISRLEGLLLTAMAAARWGADFFTRLPGGRRRS